MSQSKLGLFMAIRVILVPFMKSPLNHYEPVIPGLPGRKRFVLKVYFNHCTLQLSELDPSEHVYFCLCAGLVDAFGMDESVVENGRKVSINGLVRYRQWALEC